MPKYLDTIHTSVIYPNQLPSMYFPDPLTSFFATWQMTLWMTFAITANQAASTYSINNNGLILGQLASYAPAHQPNTDILGLTVRAYCHL